MEIKQITRTILIVMTCLFAGAVAFCAEDPSEAGDVRNDTAAVASEGESEPSLAPAGPRDEWSSLYNAPVHELPYREHGGEVLSWRFWMMPEEKIDQWPWEGGKYYPVKAETFHSWIETIEHLQEDPNDAPRNGLAGVLLSGRVDGCTITDGTGQMQLYVKEELPEAVSLTPFSFACDSFMWDNNEKAEVAARGDGLFRIENPREGQLHFSWSARGRRDSFGNVIFDLALPRNPNTEIVLQTLPGFRVETSCGVVQEVPQVELPAEGAVEGRQGEEESDSPPDPDATVVPPLRTWRLHCGGAGKVQINVIPLTRETDLLQRTGVSQNISCRVSLEGLEIASRFSFEPSETLLDELHIRLESPLTLLSMEWEHVNEKSTVLAKAQSRTGTEYVTQFQSSERVPAVLNVVASCPWSELPGMYEVLSQQLPTNDGAEADLADALFCHLPRVELTSDKVFWKETQVRIAVVRPLVVTDFQLHDTVTAWNTLTPPEDNVKLYLFKYTSPSGSIEFLPALLNGKIRFDSVTQSMYSPEEIVSTTTLRLQSEQSNVNTMDLEISRGWEIDSILSAEKRQILWETFPADQDGNYAIRLLLKRTLRKGEPLQIVLTSRRAAEAEQLLPLEVLSPLRLTNIYTGIHWLLLNTELPWQLTITDRSGHPWHASDYSKGHPLLRGSFQANNTDIVVPLGNESVGVVVRLEKMKPNYTAHITGRVRLEGESFQEKWNIECTPATGSRVDRLLVAMNRMEEEAGTDRDESPSSERDMSSDWSWQLAAETDQTIEARLLGDDEKRSQELPVDLDIWELQLLTSRSVPFEVIMTRSRASVAETDIPLVTLPEIAQEKAELVVESPLSELVTLTPSRLQSTVIAPSQPGEYGSVQHGFRYDPDLLKESTPQNLVRLVAKIHSKEDVPVATREQPLAWCWFLRFDSQHDTKGIVRNHASYHIENHGRTACVFTLPEGVEESSVHAVWVDDHRVTWYPERRDGKHALRVFLPAGKRYVHLFLEYFFADSPLTNREYIRPGIARIDMPVLSGSWGLWLPPEWNAECKGYKSGRSASDRGDGLPGFFQSSGTEMIRSVATDFVTRLGNETFCTRLLRNRGAAGPLVSGQSEVEPVPVVSGEPGPLAAGVASGTAVVTWGDVLTNPLFTAGLGTEALQEENFHILIDRYSLGRFCIRPSTPLAWPGNATLLGNGLALLDAASLSVVFLSARDVFVTSNAWCIRNRMHLQSLYGNQVWLVNNPMFAESIRKRVEEGVSPDVISARHWNETTEATQSPWLPSWRRMRTLSSVPGWNNYEFPTVDYDLSVRIANRYRMTIHEWLLFITIFVATCRKPRAGSNIPVVLVTVIGAVLVATTFWQTTFLMPLYGLLYGAICSLAFYIIRSYQPRSAIEKSIARSLNDPESESEDSEAGFVRTEVSEQADSVKMHASQNRKVPEGHPFEKIVDGHIFEDMSGNPLNGRVSPLLLSTLSGVMILVLLLLVPLLGQEPVSQSVNSASAVSGGAVPGGVTVEPAVPSAPAAAASVNGPQVSEPVVSGSGAGTSETSEQPESWKEPFRVFVPVDGQNMPAANAWYWIPEEFYLRLKNIAGQTQVDENHWAITEALYSGAVNYNSVTKTLSLFHIKVTYEILMETNEARIVLPMMPLLPDSGARFDKLPVTPSYATGESTQQLIFNVSNVSPGRHTLEFVLAMPQFGRGMSTSISIPPVADAKLELTVPLDAPAITVPDARGAVTLSGTTLMARLGPSSTLTLQRSDETGGLPGIEVEQYFRIHARVNQTDLNARFVYRISGDPVRALYLQNDPRYLFSEQCTCDEAQIESVETEDANNLVRIVFKEPVTGFITLRANYVVQGFSGTGQIRFPRIRASQARVTRSWLAVSKVSSVDFGYMPPGDLSAAVFQSEWGETATPVLTAWDLLRPGSDWYLDIRPKADEITANETSIIIFRSLTTDTGCEVDVHTTGETHQISFQTPDNFVTTTLELRDTSGNFLEAPEYVQRGTRLTLFFRTPVTGNFRVRVRGRTPSQMEKESPLPLVSLCDVTKTEQSLILYRDHRVYADVREPETWTADFTPLTGKTLALDEMEKDLFYIGSWLLPATSVDRKPEVPGEVPVSSQEVSPQSPDPGTNLTPGTPATVLLHSNQPVVSGLQECIVYQRLNMVWEAAATFALTVSHGELNSLDIELDDLCGNDITIEPFISKEIITINKKRILRLKPTVPLRGNVVFRISMPLACTTETLRFPVLNVRDRNSGTDAPASSPGAQTAPPETTTSFVLLPNSSEVRQFVFLPVREQYKLKSLLWETEHLSLRNEPDALEIQRTAMNGQSVLDIIPQLSGMTEGDFSRYEVSGQDWRAIVSLGENQTRVTGAEHWFFLRPNGSLYGTSIMDVQPGKAESCALFLPARYRLLELTLDGIDQTPVTNSDGTWSIPLTSSLKSQRIGLVFQTNGEQDRIDPKFIQAATGKTVRQELAFPRLDNISVEQTYWVCVIENEKESSLNPDVPWFVSQKNCNSQASEELPKRRFHSVKRGVDSEDSRSWKLPARYEDASPILLRLNLEKMKYLLKVFEATVPSLEEDEDNLNRWYGQWLLRWWSCRNEVEAQLVPDESVGPLTPRQDMAIFHRIVKGQDGESEEPDGVRPSPEQTAEQGAKPADYLKSDDLGKNLLLTGGSQWNLKELMDEQQRLETSWNLKASGLAWSVNRSSSLSSFAIWRLNHESDARFLIGLTNENIERIDLMIPVKRGYFTTLVFLRGMIMLLATVATLTLMKNRAYLKFVLRNVIVCGFLLGILWMLLLPPWFVGWVIIAVSFLIRWRTGRNERQLA
ncbi:MAG: hypothetical protein Q4G68_07915 [Planctomycetia bacterium]|nr:hypothetical protein [Planctomycetia bacterium]